MSSRRRNMVRRGVRSLTQAAPVRLLTQAVLPGFLLVAGCSERETAPAAPEAPVVAPLETTASGRIRAAGSTGPAVVELPATLGQPLHVADTASGLSIDATLEGATAVPARIEGGLVVYPAAGPSGADVLFRIRPDGAEDSVVFGRRPAREDVRYRLDVSAASGLRLVASTLELLDRGGVPRLRVAPPSIASAGGHVVPATLALEGCAADTDPRAPWGRPVTAPGAASCVLRIGWAGRGVAYPATLDPQWTTTGTMSSARYWHTMTPLPSGNILVAGGYDTNMNGLDTAEIYAPPPAGAFTPTSSMFSPRGGHTATKLPDGRVLVTGGTTAISGGALDLTEAYDETEGLFTPTATMAAERVNQTATLLSNGLVLVAGGNAGMTTDAEVYDPAADTFTAAGPMVANRSGHVAVLLGATPTSKVLLEGGIGLFDLAHANTAELYDPVTSTFTACAGMTTAFRTFPAAALLTKGANAGKVLITGGQNTSFMGTTSTELYDPVADLFAAAAPMLAARVNHTATALGSGAVLLIGGSENGIPIQAIASTELYDPATSAFVAEPAMTAPRAFHAAISLPSLVLVSGGANGVSSADAEVLPIPCSAAADCASGNCLAEGFCCDTACGALCNSCTAADKGHGLDGVCGLSAANIPFGQMCEEDPQKGVSFAVVVTCDGKGGIGMINLIDCLDFGCNAAGLGCATSCDAATPCSSTGFCAPAGDGGTQVCIDRLADGAACVAGAACTSAACDQCAEGHCSDGVCCDSDCGGSQCGACDTKGAPGTCVAIEGPPLASRSPCGGTGVCAGACDGQNKLACAFPLSTSCGKSTCGFGQTQAAECNGKGACAEVTTPCDAYACNAAGSSCNESCITIGDCALGDFCVDNACVPLTAPECLTDGQTLESLVDGKPQKQDCAPYACQNGHCAGTCGSVLDCAEHYVCDKSHQCVAPPSEGAGAASCICEAGAGSAGGPGSGAALVAAGGLALLFGRRRAQAPRNRASAASARAGSTPPTASARPSRGTSTTRHRPGRVVATFSSAKSSPMPSATTSAPRPRSSGELARAPLRISVMPK
jgi:hypothetical protein